MPDRFLTISDAEKFTGKSRSTLRRFIDAIVKTEDSPDRHLVLPTIDEVVALRSQAQPFSWRINEELWRRQFLKPDETPPLDSIPGNRDVSGSESSRLVTVLEKSIAMLERELSEKNNQIAAMNERLRESNILMKDLQQRLALPAAKSNDGQVVEERRTSAIDNVTTGNVTTTNITTAPTKPVESTTTSPRKSRFGWLFGE